MQIIGQVFIWCSNGGKFITDNADYRTSFHLVLKWWEVRNRQRRLYDSFHLVHKWWEQTMQIINPGISLTATVSALAYTSSNKTKVIQIKMTRGI